MCSLESMKIDLKALKADDTTYSFDLDTDFFEAINATEVNGGMVHVDLDVHRGAGFFELGFHSEGKVIVPCDLCLDDMEQPISTDNRLIVKFGEEYSEDDDLIIVEENDGIIDISWFIYEFIALNVPIKHVHAPGKCNHAMIEVLEAHSAARSSDGAAKPVVDPSWSELETLKTIIKD